MTRFLTVLAAGSALALVSVAAPTTAEARWRGGGGVAAGVIGGIAAGAIIAGAASSSYYGPGYAYDPGYAYPPAYAYESPGYYGGGYGYYYGGSACDRTSRSRQLQGTC
jgi:hypothetical protein